MSWKPDPQPVRYDRVRVATLKPLEQALLDLRLPLIRFRKLNTILGALTVQIEDGGDNPEVNRLLLEALRAGVLHQVGERQGRAALRAMDDFARDEAQRWAHIRAGTLPPMLLTPEEQLDDLMQDGYTLLDSGQQTAAVDKWLEAWEHIKQMATPRTRSTEAFDAAYRDLFQCVFNWCSDMAMELHNAGLDDPVYFTHQIRYVDEFLAHFPDEDIDHHVSMLRAKGEALWHLGRQVEAEAVYQTLIARYPDAAWGYIGWADQYYFFRARPKLYERAEALLLQALARPTLDDRGDVLDRLMGLYEEWGKPEKQARYAAEREKWSRQQSAPRRSLPTSPAAPAQTPQTVLQGTAPASSPPQRNDPCPCGSGKKYKHCHMLSDQARKG